VAILVGISEVVHGVEKQHRNIGSGLPQHVQHHHVLGLEAARDAGGLGCVELSGDHECRIAHVSISSSTRRTASTASDSEAAMRAAFAKPPAAPAGALS